MKYNRSSICRMANRLVKEGLKRAAAFVKAWAAAKKGVVEKVAGVLYGNRQKILHYLDNCKKDTIQVKLIREKANPFDENAVAVFIQVVGDGTYRVGYLPRRTAGLISSLMDTGVSFKSWLYSIVGGYDGLNYGLRIKIGI